MSYNLPTIAPLQKSAEQELRNRMPRLQTTPSELAPATTKDGTPPMRTPVSAAASASLSSSANQNHGRFILTDHVAMRYLVEDPSVTVLSRREQLEGYELYLVEQWACSRKAATFVITTYTGDPRDKVQAGIIGVPKDESTWSPALKTYFKALERSNVRPKETNMGTLMITNLSGFPSNLTVIPVPNGDMKAHRVTFYVNENLKRLGCSGRSGIKLAPPSSATVAKFHQLYKTSDKIPLDNAVIELVKLCQVAMVMFGVLESELADGLLCDVTERAVHAWWRQFGNEYYNIEPQDGVLGPTTVAGILGMLMGARNRLSAYNAPVPKDVFDIDASKRAISYFQKTQRLERTRRLDRDTLDRLRRATAKAASKEGWRVPTALKSTVAEFSGKGGEMVLGIVGGDKAGIAEIETVDIDRFVELVRGERAKWLWHGKPRKSQAEDNMFSRLPAEDGILTPTEPETAIVKLMKRESTLSEHKISRQTTSLDEERPHSSAYSDALHDPHSKRSAIKRATGKIDTGSGLNRIRDAVGLRTHGPKPSKDDTSSIPYMLHETKSELALKDTLSPLHGGRSSNEHRYEPSFSKTLTETPRESGSTLAVESQSQQPDQIKTQQREQPEEEPGSSESSRLPAADKRVADEICEEVNNLDDLPVEPVETVPLLLRRIQSSDQMTAYHASNRNNNWWPRHLSFSIAEESVLTWSPIIAATSSTEEPSAKEDAESLPLNTQLALQEYLSFSTQHLAQKLSNLHSIDETWSSTRLSFLNDLSSRADADITELEELYYTKLDIYNRLTTDTHEIVTRERVQLQEQIRDLETLGAKLDYEIGALKGKVDDVDDGINELERQVEVVENSVRELDEVLGAGKQEGWCSWCFGRVGWMFGLR